MTAAAMDPIQPSDPYRPPGERVVAQERPLDEPADRRWRVAQRAEEVRRRPPIETAESRFPFIPGGPIARVVIGAFALLLGGGILMVRLMTPSAAPDIRGPDTVADGSASC